MVCEFNLESIVNESVDEKFIIMILEVNELLMKILANYWSTMIILLIIINEIIGQNIG